MAIRGLGERGPARADPLDSFPPSRLIQPSPGLSFWPLERGSVRADGVVLVGGACADDENPYCPDDRSHPRSLSAAAGADGRVIQCLAGRRGDPLSGPAVGLRRVEVRA